MDVVVFETRKLDEANRASALLREANVPHMRTRLVGGVEVEITPDAADMPGVSWLVRVPREQVEAAKGILGGLIEETGARPRSPWVMRLYLIALFGVAIAATVRGCSS
jgi:hypothetical protein